MANRTFVCLTAVSLLLGVSGCGSSGDATTAESATSTWGPQPVELQFFVRITAPGEEGPPQARYDVITDGGKKVRMHVWLFSEPTVVEEENIYTSEGGRVLEYSSAAESPYTVWEAPNEHVGDLPDLTSVVAYLWPAVAGAECTDLGKTKTIIGHVAVGYRCAEASPEPGGPAENEVWVDQATGIQLSSCGIPCGSYVDTSAEKLVLAPATDAATYSTQPPPGAKVTVVPPN